MKYETLICIRTPVFPIGIYGYRPYGNEVYAFISVRSTITVFQTPETVYYTPRGAKWSDVKNVLSAAQNEKNEFQLKLKN